MCEVLPVQGNLVNDLKLDAYMNVCTYKFRYLCVHVIYIYNHVF